tara:strand:+ start:156 stop:749 length:594 start_codon:yes stop_codon:yes gene_type:complete
MKRASTSNPQVNPGPPQRKKQNPPARRKAPKTLPSFPSGQIKSPKRNLDNPQDVSHIFSPTISIEKAKQREEKRKRIYASKKHSMPLISIKEAQNKDKKRQMNYFAKDNINYNPNRNFPQRINDSAILANKRLPRRNKTRKKRDTSLKSLKTLKNRPPGMGGRRKTRRKTHRKKRRKTKTKKKRRKRKHKTRRKRRR